MAPAMDQKEIDNYTKIYEEFSKLTSNDKDGINNIVKKYSEVDITKFFALQQKYSMAKLDGANQTFKEFLADQ